MRVGVVGSGFGARVVAPAFAATAGCEVVGVVSARDPDAVAALAARPDVDLLSVHSPPFLHARDVRHALTHGKAVLCDKPFGLDAHEAEALAAEAAAAGVVALCNFEFRYAPAREHVRELVASGELGSVEHVTWTHFSNGSRVPLRPWGWLFDEARGGGWVGAWASHAVDTVRWMLGTEVAGVDGHRHLDVPARPDRAGTMRDCTAEDGLSASLELATGATVVLDSSFARAESLPPRLIVSGSEAMAEIVGDARVVVRRAGELSDLSNEPAPGDRHAGPMLRFAAAVRDAVERGGARAGDPTFVDGYACREVLDVLRRLPLRSTTRP
jgi:predicted dehydrogenase